MNAIHKIIAINEKELVQNIPDKASWHADYSDTAYIYIGNLHESLKEKDILAIFSQYGTPTHINLVKDRDSGRSRGFCYLKYEDQRSCVLAIDNFNGVLIYEKPLKVDHTYYKLAKGQLEDDFKVKYPKLKQIEKKRQKKIVPKLLPYGVSSREAKQGREEENTEARSGNTNEYGSHRLIPYSKRDDLSDPMASFKYDNDFSDPMSTFINDDNFDDPMAYFVKPEKSKVNSDVQRDKKNYGTMDRNSDEEESHRSKRHRRR